MKAMIFAAGLGTRLRPLTDHMPKALVRVGNATLLDRTIERLIGAGATDIVVNVHHFADQIVRHLAAHRYAARVSISDESACLLNTGGGLRHAAPLFGDGEENILIHNVDILHNADLRAFAATAEGHDATLLVSDRTTTRYLLFADDGRLVGWTNVQTGEVRSPFPDLDPARCRRLAFSGIHSMSPRLLRRMEAWPEAFPIMDFYLDVCRDADIRAAVCPGLRLLDVGKTDSLAVAERFLSEDLLPAVPVVD